MAAESKAFSESWYRIAEQSISLRPTVSVHRQFYRGERWYVLRDPYNNHFYRLRPAAYEFVVRLREGQTVEEVWRECLRLQGADAPGQEEAIRVLAGLYHANLLRYQSNADSVVLFQRFEKERKREIKSKLLGFMFPRIPLCDPDGFLKATLPYVSKLMGRCGKLLWLLVVLFAIKVVVDNFGMAVDQAQAVLAPGNLFWLYLCLVGIKVLHEFGHAYACRRAGGEVHRMGVMFLVFTPLPFVDVTASWSLRSRFRRISVASSGVVVELFVAAVAALVWSATGEGILHNICYNMMFIASVSTLLFNLNPLLRFDGYYVLSDLLDIPNLHDRARRELYYLVKRYGFGLNREQSISRTRHESRQLVTFSLLSTVYRVVVFGSIILFVAGQLMVVGIVLACFFVVAWVCVPIIKFFHYLAASPELTLHRGRSLGVVALLLVVLYTGLRVLPCPHSFDAPGVLETAQYDGMFVRTPGFLVATHVAPGERVAAGALLFELSNPELEMELAIAEARWAEGQARRRKAMVQSRADLRSIDAVIASVQRQQAQLAERKALLRVVAPYEGVWAGEELDAFAGCWFARGQQLGGLVADDQYEFSAVVSQREASWLFQEQIRTVEVRLTGQADHTLTVTELEKIPMEQTVLPSSVLGWFRGGELETEYTDPSGMVAREPFFRVVAHVPVDEALVMRHGLPGRIRFQLPPEPVMVRWMRSFSQLLQSRFRL
jgi:putative peptide zinc metalloprotease protein